MEETLSRAKRLLQSYSSFIATPWRDDAAPAQRVVFCVYNETDELVMRAKYDEFEIATKQVEHSWIRIDLSDTFANWLAPQKLSKSYFERPELLAVKMHRYQEFILDSIRTVAAEKLADKNCVVALSGVGSLFGLCKVKEIVDKVAPMVSGRLLVFFPGSFENNNYRLLDGYDGWNYLAVPITADKDC
jgi:hypothetical protein